MFRSLSKNASLVQAGARRSFSSAPVASLKEEASFNLAGFEIGRPGPVQQTTLPNGIRVISSDGPYMSAQVGVLLDAGSRFEVPEHPAVASFVELMAFRSTFNRTSFRLIREMSKVGAAINCQAGREHIMYTGDVMRRYVPQVMGTFADMINDRMYIPYELTEAREQYLKLVAERAQQPDLALSDAAHQAAWGGETLGISQTRSKAAVESLHADVLHEYTQAFSAPNRMIVGAVGVPHAEFVELVGEHFGHRTVGDSSINLVDQPAVYQGGDVRMHDAADDGLAHLMLSLEHPKWSDADLPAACVISSYLGGGGSFSTGGPGKGMCSRLFTRLLNNYGWIEHAQATSALYKDGGLFSIYASSPHQAVGELGKALAFQLADMGNVKEQELERGKNSLIGAMNIASESRGLRLEDYLKQIQMTNEYEPLAKTVESVRAVTQEDVRRVAETMLKSPLTVSAKGNLTKALRYDQLHDLIHA